MTGEITADSARAIEDLIGQLHQMADQQHKQVARGLELQVNSPGGSVQAAMAIGRMARKENMAVSVGVHDVNDICESACVLVFAGAVVRIFNPDIECDGRLGCDAGGSETSAYIALFLKFLLYFRQRM